LSELLEETFYDSFSGEEKAAAIVGNLGDESLTHEELPKGNSKKMQTFDGYQVFIFDLVSTNKRGQDGEKDDFKCMY